MPQFFSPQPITHGPPYTQADLAQARARLSWLLNAEEGDSGSNPRRGLLRREMAVQKVELIQTHLAALGGGRS